MITKELRPSRLHFPYCSKYNGLVLLAVSYDTRLQCLSDIRQSPSLVLHIHNENTVDEFLDWIKPKIAHASLHMTNLLIHARGQGHKHGFRAYSKVCDWLEVHDPTKKLVYSVKLEIFEPLRTEFGQENPKVV